MYLMLSGVYRFATGVRNKLFDLKILKTTAFDIPIISVGNIAVGGTGKTPHTEYLISLLKCDFKVAVLSRGYKRLTKGFVLADENATAQTIGDESFQIKQKYPDITVAVCEKRVDGVRHLLDLQPDLDVIILDDAFQHRYIKPGLSILLTDYSNLYIDDKVMPAGSLRENRKASLRADIIVVTKCPDAEMVPFGLITDKLNIRKWQDIYFSAYAYKELRPAFPKSINEKWTYEMLRDKTATAFVMTGIASPGKLVRFLKEYTDNVRLLQYADHHYFETKDFDQLREHYNTDCNTEKIIIVTEKDAVKIVDHPAFPDELKPYVFIVPVKVKLLKDQMKFTKKIKNYVTKDSRNS